VNGPPFPDLSVQVTRRRVRCVLDPNLALSRDGAMLARRLAPHAEQWVHPEWWNIVDGARLYTREPELVAPLGTDKALIAEIPDALRDWTQLREEARQCLHWVGETLPESYMPDDIDEAVLTRWEAASRTLDLFLPKAIEATGPLIAAMRDTAALCAVLHAAFVLSRGAHGEPPLICRHLQQWGLACEKLSSKDILVSVERAGFQRLLIEAGLAPFVWGGLPLALVHLLVPYVGRLETGPDFGQEDEPALLADEEEPVLRRNPWEGAKCFWYDVTGSGR
jgi:hypothetical protein